MKEPAEYVHPQSGRLYREGDPAHDYALAWNSAARVAERIAARLQAYGDLDYLARKAEHPHNDLLLMQQAIEWMGKAYSALIGDREFTKPDEEWHRKYGPPTGGTP